MRVISSSARLHCSPFKIDKQTSPDCLYSHTENTDTETRVWSRRVTSEQRWQAFFSATTRGRLPVGQQEVTQVRGNEVRGLWETDQGNVSIIAVIQKKRKKHQQSILCECEETEWSNCADLSEFNLPAASPWPWTAEIIIQGPGQLINGLCVRVCMCLRLCECVCLHI